MPYTKGGRAKLQTSKTTALQPYAHALVAKLQEIGRSVTSVDASKYRCTTPGIQTAIWSVSTFGQIVRWVPTAFAPMSVANRGTTPRVGTTQKRRLESKRVPELSAPHGATFTPT